MKDEVENDDKYFNPQKNAIYSKNGSLNVDETLNYYGNEIDPNSKK